MWWRPPVLRSSQLTGVCVGVYCAAGSAGNRQASAAICNAPRPQELGQRGPQRCAPEARRDGIEIADVTLGPLTDDVAMSSRAACVRCVMRRRLGAAESDPCETAAFVHCPLQERCSSAAKCGASSFAFLVKIDYGNASEHKLMLRSPTSLGYAIRYAVLCNMQ